MKKILNYFILTIAFIIVLGFKVEALTCKYSDGKLTAEFTIDEKTKKAGKATINGTIKSKDKTKIKNEKQKIENWDTIFEPGNNPDKPKKISTRGQDYYSNKKECPPYSILVDRSGQLDFAVFPESHKSDFEKYGKAKQGYAIMKLSSSKKESEKDGSDTNYEGGSCAEYTTEHACEKNEYFACIWNETEYGNFCNTDKLLYVTCGDATDIPLQAPRIISFTVNLLKIATPIILVLTSVIVLTKAITNSNEDEMKKAQKSLIRKIIAAVIVFFVISIVQFVMLKVADNNETTNLSDCLSCFLNNSCGENIYYKTGIASQYLCTSLHTGDSTTCENFYIGVTNTVSTDYYYGDVADSCSDEYFSNGYQPKSITDGGTCYTLESTGKKILVATSTLSEESKTIEQTLWKANGKCYYWEGTKNKYENVSCDAQLVTPHYSGAKAASCNNKYFTNGYQPKSITDGGTCYSLSNTNKKYNDQTLWKANNKCYYWKGSENKYIQTNC